MDEFVHLHCHSEYSILDGMSPIERGSLSLDADTLRADQITLAGKAAQLGQPGIALTDHAVMGGYYRFYNDCLHHEINPIIGCEFYVVADATKRGERPKPLHLVLLAKNYAGLQALFALNKYAYTTGFYYRPLVDFKALNRFCKGDNIIATTACIKGVLSNALLSSNEKMLSKITSSLIHIFGEHNVYYEMMPHDMEEQTVMNQLLFQWASTSPNPESLGQIILTNDVHYVNREHEEAHDAFTAIQSHSVLNDPNRFKFSVGELYVKSREEMIDSFLENNRFSKTYTEAFADNTLRINEMVNLEIPEAKTIFPVKYEGDPNQKLKDFIKKGMNEKKIKSLAKKYAEKEGIGEDEALKIYLDRVKAEFALIKKLGFVRYFLIVYELVCFAKEQDILVGPGRGSAASSLVCFLLGITSIDPIYHDLMFERFISEHRISPPDIDLDFEDDRRDEIFEWFKERVGEDNTARIGSYTIMKGKLAFKDIARVHGVPFDVSNKIAQNIMSRKGSGADKYSTIADSFKRSKTLKKFDESYPAVRVTAEILEGTIRQAGVHPCGVIAAPFDLSTMIPVETRKNPNGTGRIVVSAITAKEVEKLGLLKFDNLGLKTLTILKQTQTLVKERHGTYIDLDQIDLEDDAVLKDLSNGDFMGVFQFDTSSFRQLAQDFKFKNFFDVVVMAAVGRPGPMQSGSAAIFMSIRVGNKRVKKIHPLYDRITKDTAGIVIFQEQVIQLFHELAGYSKSDADEVRNAIGKSHGREAIEKHRVAFIQGCNLHGLEAEAAEKLFDSIRQFGKYGFNKAHATAYGKLGYQCAWLKHYYPVEFLTATLNKAKDSDNTKIREFIQWGHKHGIEVRPPDVNVSRIGYNAFENHVYMGIQNIKHIGEKGALSIIEHQPYADIFDFLDKVNRRAVNKKAVEALVKAGAMKPFCANPQFMLDMLSRALKPKKADLEFLVDELKDAKAATSSEEMFLRKEVLSVPLAEYITEYYADVFDVIRSKNPVFNLQSIVELKGEGYIIGEVANLKYSNIGDYDQDIPDEEELQKRARKGEPQGARYCRFDVVDSSGSIKVKIKAPLFHEMKEEIEEGDGSIVLLKVYDTHFSNGMWYVEDVVNLKNMRERIGTKKTNDHDKFFIVHPVHRKSAYVFRKKFDLSWFEDIEEAGIAMGIIVDYREHKTKKGYMAFIRVSDGQKSEDVVVWPDDLNRYREQLKAKGYIGLKVERGSRGNYVLKGKKKLVVNG